MSDDAFPLPNPPFGPLEALRSAGLYKTERVLTTPQSAHVTTNAGREVINLCANNYLGLADHPEVIAAAHEALDRWGYGLSSVRFICGTQTIHKELEERLSDFLGTEDTILYSSCFDANGGLFETILGEEDAIISDALNHASIIDGIRLCKAKRHRYANGNLEELERCLKEAQAQRFPAHRHGRGLFDGWIDRGPQGDLRPRRPLRGLRDGR